MQRSKCFEREARLAAERSTRCWGTASVNISILDFPNDEDQEDVEALIELFKADFRGLNPRYHIPAKIDRQSLDAALELSGLAADKLKAPPDPRHGYPELRFPAGFRLKCCQGLHRAKAAAKVLPPRARRWSIDFYDSNIGPDLDIELSEEYSAEKIPEDGVVYNKIRKYQGYRGAADSFLERRWWALIEYYSKRKKDNLKKILDDPDYREAFDIQLEIPALGDGMQLGVVHKWYTMGCHELILNYLGYIRVVWKVHICQGNQEWMRRIDPGTVRAVQHTAPGACSKDREDLYRKMQSGQIFGAFGEQERQSLWQGLVSASITCLIPSLFTLFEDVNYLEGPLESLKRLVPPCRKETISSALLRAYKDVNQEPDQCIIQESDSTFAYVPGTEADRVEMGVRQAWICSMRKSTEIPPQPKKKESVRRANPEYKESARAVHELASFLYRIGFETAEILHTIEHSADSVVAHNALLEARPPDRFAYDELALENHKRQMIGIFMTARELPTDEAVLLAELDNFVVSPKRYGKPSEAERKQTKPMLFADRLHGQEVFDEVTPFFVRRSVYLAFFGRPTFEHANIGSRRRVQSDIRPISHDSSQRELQERERRLDEEWQRLRSEKMEFRNALAEEFAKKYEEEAKMLEEKLGSQFNRQLSEERARVKIGVDQYRAAQAQIHQRFHEKQLELKNRCLQLEEEIKTLKDVIKQRDEERMPEQEKAREENRLWREAQRRLDEESKKFEERLQQVENEKQLLQNAVTQAKQERTLWEETQRRLEEENKNFKERLQQVENEKQQLQNVVTQAEQERTLWDERQRRLEEENKNFKERLQQVENEKQQLQNVVTQVEREKTLLGETQRRLEEENKDLKERLQQVENEKQPLQNAVTQVEREKTLLGETQRRLEEESKKFDERLQQVENEKQLLQSAVTQAEYEITKQQEAQRLAEGKLKAQVEELRRLEDRNKEQQETQQNFENEIKSREQEVQKLLSELKMQTEQVQQLRQEKETSEDKFKQLLQENRNLEGRNQELQGDKTATSELQTAIEDLNQDKQRIEAEMMKLKTKLEEERSLLATREQELDENRSQLRGKETQLEDSERQLQEMRVQLAEGRQALAQDRNDLNQKVQAMLQEKAQLQKEQQQHLHKTGRLLQEANSFLIPGTTASSLGNVTLNSNYRANGMSILRRLGRLADEAREKRQRVDEDGNSETKKSQQTGEVNGQSNLGVAKITNARGATRRRNARRPATQIKVQDAVASQPSGTKDMTEVADLDDPITFIFEDGDIAREELIPAAQVEETARQLKVKGNEIYDKKGLTLNAKTCYEDVIEDGTRAIVVRPRLKMDIDEDAVRKRKVQEIE